MEGGGGMIIEMHFQYHLQYSCFDTVFYYCIYVRSMRSLSDPGELVTDNGAMEFTGVSDRLYHIKGYAIGARPYEFRS